MKTTHIKNNFIYWKLGKNQKAWRKEYLPSQLIQEITEYRRTHRIREDFILSAQGRSISRKFSDLRKTLSDQWNQKLDVIKNDHFDKAYQYQLKGFRKNFQTILFKYYWDLTGDPIIALEMVCKRMKHSSRKVTFQHYIENVNSIGENIDRYFGKMPFQWIQNTGQLKLFQYYELKHSFSEFVISNY